MVHVYASGQDNITITDISAFRQSSLKYANDHSSHKNYTHVYNHSIRLHFMKIHPVLTGQIYDGWTNRHYPSPIVSRVEISIFHFVCHSNPLPVNRSVFHIYCAILEHKICFKLNIPLHTQVHWYCKYPLPAHHDQLNQVTSGQVQI